MCRPGTIPELALSKLLGSIEVAWQDQQQGVIAKPVGPMMQCHADPVTPLLSNLKLTESLSELSVSNAAGQELKHKAAMSSRQAFAHTERVDMYVHSIACYKIA